jgi:hypothetical protein
MILSFAVKNFDGYVGLLSYFLSAMLRSNRTSVNFIKIQLSYIVSKSDSSTNQENNIRKSQYPNQLIRKS